MHRLHRIARQLLSTHHKHCQRTYLHTRTNMSNQHTSAAAAMVHPVASQPATAAVADSSLPPSSSSSSTSIKLKVACVQMTSGEDMTANIAACSELIRQAAAQGAKLVCTPENTARMTAITQKSAVSAAAAGAPLPAGLGSSTTASAAPSAPAPSFSGHPVVTSLSLLATELDIWILIGSIAVRSDDDGSQEGPSDHRFVNRSVLLAPRPMAAGLNHSSSSYPSSQVVAHYDKIHLFDVPSLNGSEQYMESERVKAGKEAVVVDCSGRVNFDTTHEHTGLGSDVVLGMTICYDLRFPHLYRMLSQSGATILTVPSAFTVVTGEAHWMPLLRARAIENGAFVLAPAQVGTHPGGRRTYGHSLIVDPWGRVLAEMDGESVGVIVAELDMGEVQRARSRIPSLKLNSAFSLSKRQVG